VGTGGSDAVRIALKLDASSLTPQMSKWNPAKRRWDISSRILTARLEALKQIARWLNLYPAEPSKVEQNR
jgi:hypothetical protein